MFIYFYLRKRLGTSGPRKKWRYSKKLSISTTFNRKCHQHLTYGIKWNVFPFWKKGTFKLFEIKLEMIWQKWKRWSKEEKKLLFYFCFHSPILSYILLLFHNQPTSPSSILFFHLIMVKNILEMGEFSQVYQYKSLATMLTFCLFVSPDGLFVLCLVTNF